MLVLGILTLVSLSMDCSCMALRTPAVIVIRGFVFHPWFCMLLSNGSYLVCASSGNMSWQYVNSMNCIVCECDGDKGVSVLFGSNHKD